MKYSFHPEARAELLEAINYFEEHRSGLGLKFSKEIFSTIQRILYFPSAWSKFSENTRRCLANRFPYGVIYQIIENEIIIISITQLNREPDYWKKRLR